MASKKSTRPARKASPSKSALVPEKQPDSSSSSSSEPESEGGASSSPDSSSSGSDTLPAPSLPTSTVRGGQEANSPNSPLPSSEMSETSIPSPSAPVARPPPDTGSAPATFDEWYLRELTREFGDDLDKIRSAPDFTADSLAVLIQTLKQCSGGYSREQRRKVMERVEAAAETEMEVDNEREENGS